MTKKDFIALADTIRFANMTTDPPVFTGAAINDLATFCGEQSQHFDRPRWVKYIVGECGPNGGVKEEMDGKPHEFPY